MPIIVIGRVAAPSRRRLIALRDLGTLAHDQHVTRDAVAEHSDALCEEFDALIRDGLVERVLRGTFIPTSAGWDAIDAATAVSR